MVFLSERNYGLMTTLCGGKPSAEVSELREILKVPSRDGITQSRQCSAAAMFNSSDMVHNEGVTFFEDHPH